jgi:AraC family transcriptional regulator
MKIARHDHELASLCIAISGGYDEQLNRKSRRVEAGTIVLHPEGEAHANDHGPRITNLLTVELRPASLNLARSLSPLFGESWHRSASFLLPQAYRILRELDEISPSADLAIDDAIWETIADLVGHHRADVGRPRWLLAVRDYLEVHFADAPPMAMLSQMAGVHPVHLARSFRRAFGSSIGAFVRRCQVAAALKLVADGDLGLAEISFAAGFADQSHMTRQVGGLTGRSPGAWRSRLSAR